MTMTRLEYYDALDALAAAARRFAHTIEAAGAAAGAYDPDGRLPDDAYATRTLAMVQRDVLGAFAKAPGMMQIFTSAKE